MILAQFHFLDSGVMLTVLCYRSSTSKSGAGCSRICSTSQGGQPFQKRLKHVKSLSAVDAKNSAQDVVNARKPIFRAQNCAIAVVDVHYNELLGVYVYLWS